MSLPPLALPAIGGVHNNASRGANEAATNGRVLQPAASRQDGPDLHRGMPDDSSPQSVTSSRSTQAVQGGVVYASSGNAAPWSSGPSTIVYDDRPPPPQPPAQPARLQYERRAHEYSGGGGHSRAAPPPRQISDHRRRLSDDTTRQRSTQLSSLAFPQPLSPPMATTKGQKDLGSSPPDSRNPPVAVPGAGSDVHILIDELMSQNHLLDQQLSSITAASGSVIHGSLAAPPQPPRIVYCELCDVDQATDGSAHQHAAADGRTGAKRAVFLCQECQQLGLPCELCESCWADEHRSRRTRDHHRVPLPIVVRTEVATQEASTTASAAIVDCRAVLMLQQQMLHVLRHVAPRTTVGVASQTDESTATGAMPLALGTQPLASPPAAAAVQMGPEEAGIDHLVLLLLHLQLQEAEQRSQMVSDCDACSAASVYTLFRHIALENAILTKLPSVRHSPADHPGNQYAAREPAPATPAVPLDYVEVVYGEKHLPGQHHMLLVKLRGGAEEWVEAAVVHDCIEVQRYLMRKMTPDPSRAIATPFSPAAGEGVATGSSVLGRTEREELQRQLAQLQRIGTATASRGSLCGDLGPEPPHAPAEDDDDDEGSQSPGSQSPTKPSPPRKHAPTNSDERAALVLRRSPEQPMPAGAHSSSVARSAPQPRVAIETAPLRDAAVAEEEKAHLAAEDAVVQNFEARVKALEERHNKVRLMREEQERRLTELKARQHLNTEDDRQRVHLEYELNKDVLSREQPEVQHPLYLTADRHAALLLHKLHLEIEQAEKDRQFRQEYRRQRKELVTRGQHGAASAPVIDAADVSTEVRQGEQQSAPPARSTA